MEYLNTFREVLIKPENVVDSFVLKKKTKFQHPLSFGLIGVIIVVGFYAAVLGYRTPILAEIVSKDIDQYRQLAYWIQYAELKVSTILLPLSMFLLLTPALSVSGLFFFRDNIEGFYYNLILNLYAIGSAVLALLVLVPIWFIMPSTLFSSVLTTYLPLILVGVVVVRIYERYLFMEGFLSWVRVLSNYILGSAVFLVLESFTASVLGYFIFAVNRFLDIWVTI